MSAEKFTHDVFSSHSSKDKVIVHPLAERLRSDGLRVWLDEWTIKPGDSIPAKIDPPPRRSYGETREGLEHTRVLACPAAALRRRRMLCMSANAFGPDPAHGGIGGGHVPVSRPPKRPAVAVPPDPI